MIVEGSIDWLLPAVRLLVLVGNVCASGIQQHSSASDGCDIRLQFCNMFVMILKKHS